MNIEKQDVAAQHQKLTIHIQKDDFQPEIDKALKQYQKTAVIQGFRKGQAPMSMLKKQYGPSIKLDKINQMLQKELNAYVSENKLDMLGNPIPVTDSTIDWDADNLAFEFEIGLAPKFKVDLEQSKVDYLDISVTDDQLTEFVTNFQNRFGQQQSLDAVEQGAIFSVSVLHQGQEEPKLIHLKWEALKAPEMFNGKNVGDVVTVNAQDLYRDSHQLEGAFGLNHEQAHSFNDELTIEIKEISKINPAQVDQTLFDKVYGDGTVSSEADFRAKIKEEIETSYVQESDRYFSNRVLELLLENTSMELPKAFLEKWLRYSDDKIQDEDQAKEAYASSENGLKLQLIQNCIARDFEIKIEAQEVIEEAKSMVKKQMAMYGQNAFSDEDINYIVDGALKNQQEAERLSQMVFNNKITDLFKDKALSGRKNVTFEEFVDLVSK